jgi:hypothetical protein
MLYCLRRCDVLIPTAGEYLTNFLFRNHGAESMDNGARALLLIDFIMSVCSGEVCDLMIPKSCVETGGMQTLVLESLDL